MYSEFTYEDFIGLIQELEEEWRKTPAGKWVIYPPLSSEAMHEVVEEYIEKLKNEADGNIG